MHAAFEHLATAERGFEGETMTAKQKKFILNKLIPFILREQGRGFVMHSWLIRGAAGNTFYNGDLRSDVLMPSCGMACCMGGSIEVLRPKVMAKIKSLNPQRVHLRFEEAGALIGLNCAQATTLFHQDIKWPEPFATSYLIASTPIKKAKVAVALLKKVVRTNGKCLDSAAGK